MNNSLLASASLRDFVYGGMSTYFIPRLLRRMGGRFGISIFSYHGVVDKPLGLPDWCFIDVDDFREQMRYLHENVRVLSLFDALECMRQGDTKQPIAVITFDDGFQNNCDVALPVLEEFSFPATVFLATSYIGSNDEIWFCRLLRYLNDSLVGSFEWLGDTYDLSSKVKKVDASRYLQRKLKSYPALQLELELEKISKSLEITEKLGGSEQSPFRMLSLESVQRMQTSGLIEFGAHTIDHTILSRLSEEEKRHQILSSISAVERLTSAPCRFFAYPNGSFSDYDEQCLAILEATDITAALTMEPGLNDSKTPMLELHRCDVGAGDSLARFKLQAHNLV